MINHITDQAARARALLLEQFKGKENFTKLVNVLVAPFQEIEDVAWDLGTLCDLDNSFGVQLDRLGDIFNVSRAGRNDDQFRLAIQIRIFERSTSGTPDELMTVLKALTGGALVHYWPVYPAGIQLLTNAEEVPPDLLEIMTTLAGAGIGLWIYVTEGLLPLSTSDETEESLLLIVDGFVEVNGENLGISSGVDPLPVPFGGTFCDIDPEGNFETDETSAQATDVLQV